MHNITLVNAVLNKQLLKRVKRVYIIPNII